MHPNLLAGLVGNSLGNGVGLVPCTAICGSVGSVGCHLATGFGRNLQVGQFPCGSAVAVALVKECNADGLAQELGRDAHCVGRIHVP